MRHALFLAAALASGAAQADWSPSYRSNNYVVTVSYNGGSVSYGESATADNGRITPFAREMLGIRTVLENSINGVVGAAVAQQGAGFQGGTLSGNLHAHIQPAAPDTLLMRLDGLNYEARSTYSGKRWGIVSYSCTNTFSAKNLVLTGQYGANNGVLLPSVGVTSDVNSSTDCDSNLSWMLPIVGDLLVNKVTGKLDTRLEEGARSAMNGIKDKLLYTPDPNWGIGVLRLVPASLQITTADGRPFNIGQFIANNLPYLLGNSQIDLQFGRGVSVKLVPGIAEPMQTFYDENIVTINISSPSATFAIRVSQQTNVDWKWRCPGTRPCSIP